MAETYRGLTIKIGGDTTELTKALKYPTSAIGQMQVELGKLAQALKLDPTNVQVYNTHLSFMGQQASNTAAKLALLKDAQESVNKEKLKIVEDGQIVEAGQTFGDFVQKYRDGTASITADTQAAKQSLDSYTEQLAETYTNLTNYVKSASGVKSEELSAAFEMAMAPAGQLEDVIDRVYEKFYTLPDGVERSDQSIEVLVERAKSLKDIFAGVFNASDLTFDVKAFETAISQISDRTGGVFRANNKEISEMSASIKQRVEEIHDSLTKSHKLDDSSAMQQASEQIVQWISRVISNTNLMSETFTRANSNLDLSHITAVLESVAAETGMSTQQVDLFLDQLDELKQNFLDADTAYKNFLQAEKIIDLEVEIEKTQAQIKSMARAMADIKVPDNISRSLMYVQENVKALEDSFKELLGTVSSMGSIMEETGRTSMKVELGDPSQSVEVFEVAMRSLVQAEQNVQEGVAKIRTEMDAFAEKGQFLENVTDSTKSATQQLYDAKDAMVEAETELAELTGQLDRYGALLGELSAKDGTNLQTLTVEHNIESFSEAEKAAIRYYQSIDDASEKERVYREELTKNARAIVDSIEAIEDEDERQRKLNEARSDTVKKLSELGGAVDGATGKYENLAAAEQKVKAAQQALEDAKVRKALEDLQKELVETQNQTAKVDAAIKNLAQSMTTQMTTTFADNLFGDVNRHTETLKAAFDAAIQKAKTLSDASDKVPQNMELAAKKTEAMDDAVKTSELYIKELKDQMADILPDGETDEVRALREEFGTAKYAVAELTVEADTLNQQLVKARQQRDLAPEGSEKWDELNDEVEELNGKLEVTKNRLQGVEGETVGAIRIAQYESLGDEVDKTTSSVESLGKSSTDSSAAFEQAFDRMLNYAQRVGGAIVESANTIDAAYRDMRKTVQGTEEEFEALKQSAIDFSQTHAVSSDTLLEMEALGGQLGVTTSALEDFGKVAANLDIATDIDADTVALQLGQISNVMGDLNEDTFDNFSDALVRLGNNMAAQESSIMNVAQRMSSVANVANMTTPDLLAWASAIASTGQRSESAATAVSNTMTGISAAVAAGGKDLKAFAGIADMTAEQFATTWMNDPSDALKAFIDGLESLTDTNTGAIAALENMGISSVRQETALLGLASTVDVLDDALAMSNDAFNGVSDQWGQAGDAAIEAQKKSEGFSGSLQILKNNTANLSESLGDSLIVPMQIASEALKGLTDLLNFVPDPIKGVALAITGLTAVGGVALDGIDKLKKGFDGLNNIPAGSAIESLTHKLIELVPQLEENATLAAALGTGLAMGGVVVATAAIGALISALVESAEEAKAAYDANEKLADANKHLSNAVDGVVDKTDKLDDSLKVIKVTTEDATQAINALADEVDELAKKIEDRQMKLDVDFSQLDEAVGVVSSFTNSTRLTLDQQADLINAVETVNDKMGTSFEVIDATKGVIKDLGDGSVVTGNQIKQWAEKYKSLEEGEKIVQDMDDTYETLASTQKLLADAQAELTKLEEQGKQPLAETVTMRREDADAMVGQTKAQQDLMRDYAGTNESIETQRGLVAKYQDQVDELTKQYEEQKEKAHDLRVEEIAMADEAASSIEKILQVELAARGALKGIDTSEMAEQFVHLGATVGDMVELTDYQLTMLVRAYDGTTESLANALHELGLDFSGAMDKIGEAAKKAANTVGKASQEEIRAQQEKNTAEYNALKHHLDGIYDDQKKYFDKQYDLKKTEYDKDYDTLKRALDREYDERKQYLDKIYDDAKDSADKIEETKKRELDHEYTDLKNSLDKQYNELKTSLDRQVDETKKSYDRQYDDIKKSLDRQTEELKKSLDNQAAELKKSLDNQYNDIKKTLDKEYSAYKSTLDGEYNARKKTLDSELSAKKKELDSSYNERKKALDKEYKTAQKASQKYLKDYKNAQKAQTDAFKKETDARVKDIQRELDAKKALIDADTKRKTDDIDARIAALKGETEAVEKAQKEQEQQEKLSELRRGIAKAKSKRTRAEAEKAYYDYVTEIEQEAAKEQIAAEIDRLEAEKDNLESSGDERKKLLDEQYQSEIDAYKASRETELAALQEFLDAAYEKEQEAETVRLEGIKSRNDAELEGIKEANTARLEVIKEAHSNELASIKEQNDLLLQTRKEQNEAQLLSVKEQNDAQLQMAKDQNAEQLQMVKDQNAAELLAIKDQNEAEIQAMKDANALTLEERKLANEAELTAKKEGNADILQSVKDANQTTLDELKLSHETELQELKYEHEDKQNEKKRENTEALDTFKQGQQDQLDALKDSHTQQLEQLKASQTHMINQMRSGKSDVDGVLDEGVQSVETKAASATEKFGTETDKMEGKAKDSADNAMKGLWNTINDSADKVGFSVKDGPVKKANDEMDMLPDAFKGTGNKAVEKFVGPLRDAKDVEAATKYMIGLSTKEADKTKEGFEGAAKGGVQKFGTTIKNSNEGKQGATQFKDSTVGGLNGLDSQMGSKATAGGQSFGNAIKNYNTSSFTSEFVSKVIRGINPASGTHFYQELLTAGYNFIVGFVNGSNDFDIGAWASRLAQSILGDFTRGLEERSPSRATMRAGRYFVQGAIIGMQQESGNLERETKLLAQSMTDSVRPELDVDGLKERSDVMLADYKRMLSKMEDAAEASAAGIGSFGKSLDPKLLRDISQRYIESCRESLDDLLRAAESESFGNGVFDVDSFRKSAEEYENTYKRAMYEVRDVMREYGADVAARGLSPLVSDFDVASLDEEAARFEREYSDAITKIEQLAKLHEDKAKLAASEFDANELMRTSSAFLDDYKGVLDTMRGYAESSVSDMVRYDVTGLGGGVTAGSDLVASVIDGMASMEGELERQVAHLAEVIEDGFDPTLDTVEMENATNRMLTGLSRSMDAIIEQWRAGAERMVEVQRSLVSNTYSEQEDLSRRMATVVSDGFGNDRLTDQVNEFLDQTVIAAYEAIDKINARMRNSAIEIAAMQAEVLGKSQYTAAAQQQQPTTVNINVTLTDVTIRETADIDKLARALAQRTNQIMRSKIG